MLPQVTYTKSKYTKRKPAKIVIFSVHQKTKQNKLVAAKQVLFKQAPFLIKVIMELQESSILAMQLIEMVITTFHKTLTNHRR